MIHQARHLSITSETGAQETYSPLGHLTSGRRTQRARHVRGQDAKTRTVALVALLALISVLTLGLVQIARAVPSNANLAKPTQGMQSRENDPSTMEDYPAFLLGGGIEGSDWSETYEEGKDNGTRYAGRIWTDKTVLSTSVETNAQGMPSTNATSELTMKMDGFDGSVSTSEDFLHVYSALGSSQRLVGETPVDLVFVLDCSASMGSPTDEDSAIRQSLTAINNVIYNLMNANENNRVGVVFFGDVSCTVLPLGHYTLQGAEKKYLTVNQRIFNYKNNKNRFQYIFKVQNIQLGNNSPSVKADSAIPEYVVSSYEDFDWDTNKPVTTNDSITLEKFNKATGEECTISNKIPNIGCTTNLQAGYYEALSMLANEENTTTSLINGIEVSHYPTVVTLTDGAFNHVLLQKQSDDELGISFTPATPGEEESTSERTMTVKAGPEWWDLDNTPNYLGSDENLSGTCSYPDISPNPAILFNTILTTAYWKAEAGAHYTEQSNGTTPINVTMDNLFLNIGSTDYNASTNVGNYILGQFSQAGLDPGQYFNSSNPFESANGYQGGGNKGTKKEKVIQDAYSMWQQWCNNTGEETMNFTGYGNYYKAIAVDIQIKPSLDDENKTAIQNNLDYADYYAELQGYDQIEQQIADLVREASTNVFVPLSGTNDLDTDDYLTYFDPLGINMEVKNPYTSGAVAAGQTVTGSNPQDTAARPQTNVPIGNGDMNLLLFGTMYPVVRTAVYDYQFNTAYLTNHSNDKDGSGQLKAGWYYGNDGKTAIRATETQTDSDGSSYPIAGNGSAPATTSNQDAWAKGWVYRVNFSTITQFVPNLINTEASEDLNTKQQNTVYTMYRFNIPDAVRQALRMNPAYGTSVPQAAIDADKAEPDNPYAHLVYQGVYKLNDIRIWVEDTGDWQDEYTGSIATDVGYDDAVYFNIPNNALPLQTATMTFGNEGMGEKVKPYVTNLGGDYEGDPTSNPIPYYQQSTPVRLFYSVGIEDDLLYDSGDVDVSRLGKEYIDNHSRTDGSLWFISNYYGEATHQTTYASGVLPVDMYITGASAKPETEPSPEEDYTAPTLYTSAIPEGGTPTYYLFDSDPSQVLQTFTSITSKAGAEAQLKTLLTSQGEGAQQLTSAPSFSKLGNVYANQYVAIVVYSQDNTVTAIGSCQANAIATPETADSAGSLTLILNGDNKLSPVPQPYSTSTNEGVASPTTQITYYLVNPGFNVALAENWNRQTTANQVTAMFTSEESFIGGVTGYSIWDSGSTVPFTSDDTGKTLIAIQYDANDEIFAFGVLPISIAATDTGGGTSAQMQQGNAASTFSPSIDNRYYVFQKNLFLYEIKNFEPTDDQPRPPELQIVASDPKADQASLDADSSTLTGVNETVYKRVDRVEYIDSEGNPTYEPETETSGGILRSDGWYYIVIDYYTKPEANTNKPQTKQIAVPRQGSEFGSEIAGNNVHFADYLCWYAPPANNQETAKTDNVGNVNEGPYKLNPYPGKENNDQYYIATKIGGLRTGRLNSQIRTKSTNNTQTAPTYYYPAISSTLSESNGNGNHTDASNVSVDIFLGNNGIEVMQNTNVLVTKLVRDPEGQIVSPAHSFDYQIFIPGFTRTYREAHVVFWNEYANLWQQRVSTIYALTNNVGLLEQANTQDVPIKVIAPTAEDKSVVKGSSIRTSGTAGEGEAEYYIYLSGEESERENTLVYSAPENTSQGVGGYTMYVSNPNQQNLTNPFVQYVYDANKTPGTVEFWIGNGEQSGGVHLISASDYDKNPSDWKPPTNQQLESLPYVDKLVVGALYATPDYGFRCSTSVDSPYGLQVNFLSQRVFFGYQPNQSVNPDTGAIEGGEYLTSQALYDPNSLQSVRASGHPLYTAGQIAAGGSPDLIEQNTGQFTLNNGEGLLFTGIPYDTTFRVTELMNEATSDAYDLKQARLVGDSGFGEWTVGEGKIVKDYDNSLTEGYNPKYESNKAQDPSLLGAASMNNVGSFTNVYLSGQGYTGALEGKEENLGYPVDNAAYFGLNSVVENEYRNDEIYSIFSATSSFTKSVQYENTWSNGDVTLTKRVAEEEVANTAYNFTATFKTLNEDGSTSPYDSAITYNITSGYGQVTGGVPQPQKPEGSPGGPFADIDGGSVKPGTENGVVEFSLSANQTITFTNLPKDTIVDLQEPDGNAIWTQVEPEVSSGDMNHRNIVVAPGNSIVWQALNVPKNSLAIGKNVKGYPNQPFTFAALFTTNKDNPNQNPYTGTINYEIFGTGAVTSPVNTPPSDGTSGSINLSGDGNPVKFWLTSNSTIVFSGFNPSEDPIYYTVTETNLDSSWQCSWSSDIAEGDFAPVIDGLNISGQVPNDNNASVSLVAENTPPGSLTVTKRMADGQTSDQAFTFQATFTYAETNTPYEGQIDYTIQPADGGTVTFPSPNPNEDPGEPDDEADDPGPEGESANQEEPGMPEATSSGSLTLNGESQGTVTFTLKPNASITFSGLPMDTFYTVDEIVTNGYNVSWGDAGNSGTITIDTPNATATATNSTSPSPQTASFSVTKLISGGQGTSQNEFPMKVTLYRDSGLQTIATEINGTYGSNPAVRFENGVASFTLRAGQTVRWTGLPTGLYFQVVETNPMGYEASWTATGTTGTTGSTESGPAIWGPLGSHVALTCNNVPGTQLKAEVSPGDGKTVGIGQEITYNITYKNEGASAANITITDPLDEGVDFVRASIPRTGTSPLTLQSASSPSGTQSVEDGGYSISFDPTGTVPPACPKPPYPSKGLVTWVIPNVPAGATGTVSLTVRVNALAAETGEGMPGKVENQAFVSWDNGASWIPTTIPENPLTQISLEKVLLEEDASGVDWFTFKITVTSPEGMDSISGSYPIIYEPGGASTVTFVDGVATFNLKPDQTITLIGLPAGATYTYEEISTTTAGTTTPIAESDYQVTWSPSDTGTVYADATANTAFSCYNVGSGQHKVELVPGDGETVQVGQQITYRIFWENTSDEPQTVTIVDPLDVGLTFVSASMPLPDGQELTLAAPQSSATSGDRSITYREGAPDIGGNTLDYESNAYVTWNLGEQAAGASGYVTLVAEVNENALEADIVKNQAFVGWDNQWFPTEEPENPLGGPHKIELDPGDGIGVAVGQTITYEIRYQNTTSEPADITIVDPIDSGADFVSATIPTAQGADLTLRAPSTSLNGTGVFDGYSIVHDPNATTLPEGCEFTKPYDWKGLVTWVIPDVAPGATGSVYLTVVVNENALTDHLIDDQAFVKVGDGPWQPTEEPENPLDEQPEKAEITPGDGETVGIGQEITYEIHWVNNAVDENGQPTAGEVTIIDPIDKGVDFVSASDGGTYDPNGTLPPGMAVDYDWHGTVTWSLGRQPAGASGTVTLTVRVNENALETGIVKDRAFVGVDNVFKPTTEPENPMPNNPDTPGNPSTPGPSDKPGPTIYPANPNGAYPQTGDATPLGLYALIAGVSVLLILGAITLIRQTTSPAGPGLRFGRGEEIDDGLHPSHRRGGRNIGPRRRGGLHFR